MASLMQEPYIGIKCTSCSLGTFQIPNDGKEWHLECTSCGAVLLVYEPQPHQAAFHADKAKYRMFAGGYGSAKTTTCCAEIIMHILATPRGNTLIGASTLPQLEQTAMKQFFEMMPSKFIKDYSVQKKVVEMTNGHRVLFRPLDDEGKARSLNLTAWWIEEASEVPFEYFVQLQTRLRNHATTEHMGILSTNPDMNWIKTEFLLKSYRIENSDIHYHQDITEINRDFSTHIAPTHLNKHLPPDFYESTARGKEEWWVRRYLEGSFENKQGLVYPQFQDCLVEPFNIPDNWERGFAADFGLRDPTVGLLSAIDPKDGTVYFYDLHYQSEKSVKHHAECFNERLKAIPPGRLRYAVGDPKGRAKSERDLKSIFDHYGEYGIYFDAASNKIEDGVMKVYTYMDLGKVKIFNSPAMQPMIKEGLAYKYPDQKVDADKNAGDKPVDKDNHAMDCLRYSIQELPDDPSYLVNKSYKSELIYDKLKNEQHLPYALQDDDNHVNVNDWQNYY